MFKFATTDFVLQRTFIAIDLKSFYASVECVDRHLDPLTTNLVVADLTRTEKTICLAVSPSLKSYGISSRARLFEVVQQVKAVNRQRRRDAPGWKLTTKSTDNPTVQNNPSCELDYIVAPPRMARYMEVSSKVFSIYLKYVAPEDIIAYSCDEIFADVTHYLKTYGCSAHELVMRMIRDVLANTGITATAGIGTNLFLAKVAMDIKAKHQQADRDGVRIAQMDEMGFRLQMWTHKPLTDFWRVGRATAARLQSAGITTMGELARRSRDRNWQMWLYKQFGVNAELLIDHAWGYEPCTMSQIKEYRPQTNSLSSGQVLPEPYSFEKARVVIREMADNLSLELVSKHLKTNQVVLSIGYDTESVSTCKGELVSDWYGRTVPKPSHGSSNLGRYSSSSSLILEAVSELFDKIADRGLLVRRLNIAVNHLLPDNDARCAGELCIFENESDNERERKVQESMLSIKSKYGKNAILKGMNFDEGATARQRNEQIGGHKA